jgi:hypothetical protein
MQSKIWARLTTLYILQEKIEWIIIFIHLYVLNILIHQLQVTNIMLHVTFLDYVILLMNKSLNY